MKISEEILNELKEISPSLAKMDRNNPFSVPEGYFSALSDRLLINTKIYAEQADSSINSARVPEGYFDNLSSHILNKIKNQDTSVEEFPLLSSLRDKNVFSVPEGYFKSLSDQVLSKIAHKPAKVISIKSWMKYAAAAVIVGVMAIAGLQIYNGNDANHQLASNDKLPTYIQSSFQYKTPEQVDEGIASLTDDQIVKYLEKHGSIIDNDLLVNDVNTDELPATTDYLNDENTLGDYLDKIDNLSKN